MEAQVRLSSLEYLDRLMIRALDIRYFKLVRTVSAVERFEYAASTIKKIGKKGLRILDVGCGRGALLLYLDKFCAEQVNEYVGIDLNTEKINNNFGAQNINYSFHKIDLNEKFQLGEFDLVCCLEVLEHFFDDSRLLTNLCSHLSKDGHLLVSTPSQNFVKFMDSVVPGFGNVSPIQDGGHVRQGYNAADFIAFAEQNDLKIISFNWISRFEPNFFKSYMRSRNSTMGRVTHNFTRLWSKDMRSCIDGIPRECEDKYLSIAPHFVRKSS